MLLESHLDDKSIKVEFASGGGSYWDADANKMVIDRTAPMARNALSPISTVWVAPAQ